MRVCDSKLRLLQTAHELIWRQSYGSVGVDQICEQSGVKKGSFYHFFRSKSELTVAAYENYWEQSRLVLDRIFSAQVPPLERLDAYFENIRRNQTEHFETHGRVLGCPFVSLGSELSTQDEAIRLMAQKIGERKCRYLESTLRDAIDAGDDKEIKEELGDLLLQVVLHSQMASEEGRFDMDDVATVIADKLMHRHPHVFGENKLPDSEAVRQ